jgi:FkbM family methyltransferase
MNRPNTLNSGLWSPCITKSLIFDIGANNGDDLGYYLRKAEVVVAVEANPVLAEEIRLRYRSEIAAGALYVENAALTTSAEDSARDGQSVPFYIHRKSHVLSQFPRPRTEELDQFEQVRVPSITAAALVTKYGYPLYVKIDVEHFDQAILRDLFRNSIFPPYISAESHSIEVLAILSALGGYDAFKLVDGASVSQVYQSHSITTKEGRIEVHSFPEHAAGPFGDDVKGKWMRADDLFEMLRLSGLGWKDIHATRIANLPSSELMNEEEAVRSLALYGKTEEVIAKAIYRLDRTRLLRFVLRLLGREQRIRELSEALGKSEIFALAWRYLVTRFSNYRQGNFSGGGP